MLDSFGAKVYNCMTEILRGATMNEGMKNSIIYTLIQAVMDKSEKDYVIIAIDGPSASGKSSFARSIEKTFDCNLFHMDDFALPQELKTPERLSEPGGIIDRDRFKNEVLDKVVLGEPFTYKRFNRRSGKTTVSDTVKPKKLNIVEGVYSMHPDFLKYYDYTIFFDVSREKQMERIKKSSNARTQARYRNEIIPLEDKYFEAYNSRANANFSFNTTRAF